MNQDVYVTACQIGAQQIASRVNLDFSKIDYEEDYLKGDGRVVTLDPMTILFILRMIVLAYQCFFTKKLPDALAKCRNLGVVERMVFRHRLRKLVDARLPEMSKGDRKMVAKNLATALFKLGDEITESEADWVITDAKVAKSDMEASIKLWQ